MRTGRSIRSAETHRKIKIWYLSSVLVNGMFFGLMAYFVILNLLAFLVAFRKKWAVASFLGLGLTLIGMVIIADTAPRRGIERTMSFAYIVFAWLTYIAIPLVGAYRAKIRFAKRDVVLLSINTFFSAVILLFSISWNGFDDFLGITSALLAAAYFGICCIIARKFDDEKPMAALFFITGITFAVLFVPFELNAAWFAPAWLAQALGLVVYGIIKEQKNFRRAGTAIAAICLAWFVLVDVENAIAVGPGLGFTLKYASITAAGFVVLAALSYKKNIYGGYQKSFKYAVMLNFWVFVLYGIGRFAAYLIESFPYSAINIDYLAMSFMGMVTIFYSLALPKIKFFLDDGIRRISTGLSIVGISGIFILNVTFSPVAGIIGEQEMAILVIAIKILFFDSALSAYAVFNVTRRAVVQRMIGVQYLPLICSAYITIISTINLVNQFGLGFASFWITIIYVLTALVWTVIGFYKRYALLRAFGLVMSLLSVAKFFLVDLFVLTEGLRILSYFALGVALVGISFVYQYFNRRLELAAPTE